jgi:phosphomannomutase
MYEMAATAALLGVGCDVVRLGIATTPGVAVMTRHLAADAGLVITASHNPVIWNGLKPLRHDGTSPPPADVQAIIARYEQAAADLVDVHQLGRASDNEQVAAVHRDAVLATVDAEAIRAAGLTVALDSIHGAGGPETIALLDALGIRSPAQLHHDHREPTGLFPHAPEPTREHLAAFCRRIPECGAAVGFAQDPDADRLAIIDETGRYIGEEYTLALGALHRLEAGGAVVANLSTSRMIDDIAQNVGGRVVRTAVGEANVAQGMRQEGAAVGGEGNGGIIDPRVSYVRDSLVGIATVLELMAQRGEALSAIVDALPAYAMVKTKAAVTPELLAKLTPTLKQAFSDQKIDTQDGVRIDWPDRWLHVRPSNTEPIVRLIAEARDEAAAQGIIGEAKRALGL